MRALHPGLVHLLGRELFHQFALSYLEEHPSRTHSLLRLDERFVEHLERTRPAPEDDGDGRWSALPDLVIDMARFERLQNEVLDGPGTENGAEGAGGAAPHLAAPHLAALPPRSGLPPPDLVLTPAPCLRLLRTSFPVHSYVAAVERGEDPAPPEPRPTFVVLTRRNYEVVTRELTPRAHATLQAMVSGAPIAEALRGPGGEQGISWLRDWLASGFFVAARPSTGHDADQAPPDDGGEKPEPSERLDAPRPPTPVPGGRGTAAM
nr:hypothetical protein GCM10020241_54750 [Streptoalloteichus tenebrarius]